MKTLLILAISIFVHHHTMAEEIGHSFQFVFGDEQDEFGNLFFSLKGDAEIPLFGKATILSDSVTLWPSKIKISYENGKVQGLNNRMIPGHSDFRAVMINNASLMSVKIPVFSIWENELTGLDESGSFSFQIGLPIYKYDEKSALFHQVSLIWSDRLFFDIDMGRLNVLRVESLKTDSNQCDFKNREKRQFFISELELHRPTNSIGDANP